ncbi:hypothetical protein BT96DRAFT_835150 [Gymnopus androsaceus JB14]|uniref:Uncharacterized protein n=1 Tax=Gymnopus androsaceus JB14 TaxID=1447944 RepID=A0A6A4GV36_9AGAR|nr:hypothetical protein BT96DRAFT_835150 [Gymnopus androsaceus JB14]
MLASISPPASHSHIQATLSDVESSLRSISKDLDLITRPEVSVVVQEARDSIKFIEDSLRSWRSYFPDTTPFRVDNSNSFSGNARRPKDVALVVYTIALVQRIFHGAGQRASSFTLRAMKIFGHALTEYAGGPTIEQERVLDQIPNTISTAEKRLNLDIPTVLYAVCPNCSFLHKASYSPGFTTPVYPETCTNRSAPFRPACGTSLLQDGHPIKVFEYYSFFEWFGRLLAFPGVEQYGDRFCEEVKDTPLTPEDKSRTSDGRFYREMEDSEGKLFIADRGAEGRWFFKLHADFFKIEGNRIGGQSSSTGVMSITCLNLPPEMREDSAFTLIPGIIQGHFEPDSKEAQHQYFISPIVEELFIGYTRGVQCFGTHSSYSDNPENHVPYERVHKLALASVVMDFKAARPFTGLSDVQSRIYCVYCKVWHRFHMLRTDCEHWECADDDRLREGSEKWQSAETATERKNILQFYGSRYSPLWKLPYWRPSLQLIVDPMHTMFLVLMQRFFRDRRALGLAVVEKKGDKMGKKQKDKTTEPHESHIAFYYPYEPPPAVSLHFSDAERQSALQNLSKTMNFNSAIAVGDIHRYLCRPVKGDNAAVRTKLLGDLLECTEDALKFVCIDLNRLPFGNFTKRDLAQALIVWRMEKPLPPLTRVPVDSSAVLARIHRVIRELITPAWVIKPPFDVGLPRAGNLKADLWRILFGIYIPLALLSLWQADSPISAENTAPMAPALDTAMHLTCASLMMTKGTLTSRHREQFRYSLRRHIDGLKQCFPGFELPSHHLAFHIYNFMDLFSNVRNWWCFPGEQLIGKLRRIPINHKIGQFERTLLHSFSRGSAFRRWLMRDDCPGLVKSIARLINKAFAESHDALNTEADTESDGDVGGESNFDFTADSMIPELVSISGVRFLSRIEAPCGFYTIPSAQGAGNSYVTFYPNGDSSCEWVAGRIHHIFEDIRGRTKLAIRRSIALTQGIPDPFGAFWADGFQAKLVSTEFSSEFEIVEIDWIRGHSARWELNANLAVVLDLPKVSHHPVINGK